eukprot:gene12617-2306_t
MRTIGAWRQAPTPARGACPMETLRVPSPTTPRLTRPRRCVTPRPGAPVLVAAVPSDWLLRVHLLILSSPHPSLHTNPLPTAGFQAVAAPRAPCYRWPRDPDLLLSAGNPGVSPDYATSDACDCVSPDHGPGHPALDTDLHSAGHGSLCPPGSLSPGLSPDYAPAEYELPGDHRQADTVDDLLQTLHASPSGAACPPALPFVCPPEWAHSVVTLSPSCGHRR